MGKIKEKLENLVRSTALVTGMALPVLFGGCEPKYCPPKAKLEVSPTYGRLPLEVNIKLSRTEEDGAGDKINYPLIIDGKEIRNANYPLDTIITFRNDSYYKKDYKNVNIVGKVIDDKGNVSSDYEYVRVYPRGANMFAQPDDRTKNWYGSGDIDNDNKSATNEDLDLLVKVINGEYQNPNDSRLMARSDINGDREINENDLEILAKKNNGVILYLPGEWNLLMLPQERKDWLKKMIKDDKTNEMNNLPYFDCDEHTYQAMMNLSGFKPEDIPKFLQSNRYYDTTKICFYNIPTVYLGIGFYNENDSTIGHHAEVGVVIGDNLLNMEEICIFSGQTDSMDIDIAEIIPASDYQRVWIEGPPVLFGQDSTGKKYVGLTGYLEYSLKDNIFNLVWTNPKIELITEREK